MDESSDSIQRPKRSGDAGMGGGLRVLLVDDNVTNRQLMQIVLGSIGCKADMVSSGADAIRTLQEKQFDVVLMDCQMPMMDGYEVTRRIRSADSKVIDRKIPVIAMTAFAMAGDRDKCLAAGMNDYLSKPVRPEDLTAVLARLFPASDAPHTPPPQQLLADEPAVEEVDRIFNEASFIKLLMVDKNLARKVVAGFLEDMPRQLESLRTQVGNSDLAGCKAQVHTIKGAASVVGAELLRDLAIEVEKSFEAENVDYAELVQRFETEFERFKIHVIELGWG